MLNVPASYCVPDIKLRMNYSFDVNNKNEVPKFLIPKMAAFQRGFVQIQVHIDIGGAQSMVHTCYQQNCDDV